jgi:GAF domain-containing protein
VCIASADTSKLSWAIFPNLPASFQAAIADIPMPPPFFGSCTAAMYERQVVTTNDIVTETRFDERFVRHCVEHSILSLQSRPVFGRDGQPLGTFVMGFSGPREPGDFDLALLEFAADANGAAAAGARWVRGVAPLGSLNRRLRWARGIGDLGL